MHMKICGIWGRSIIPWLSEIELSLEANNTESRHGIFFVEYRGGENFQAKLNRNRYEHVIVSKNDVMFCYHRDGIA